jgi:hypothetical protein
VPLQGGSAAFRHAADVLGRESDFQRQRLQALRHRPAGFRSRPHRGLGEETSRASDLSGVVRLPSLRGSTVCAGPYVTSRGRRAMACSTTCRSVAGVNGFERKAPGTPPVSSGTNPEIKTIGMVG